MKRKIINALKTIFIYLIVKIMPFILLIAPIALAIIYSAWWLFAEILSIIIILLIIAFSDAKEYEDRDFFLGDDKQLLR